MEKIDMKSISQASTLKASTRQILDELLAQLEKRGETLRGVEATIITKELAYRQGEFVVKETRKEQSVLSDTQKAGGVMDDLTILCEMLAGSKYSIEELPGGKHNLIRILAKPANPGKFNIANFRPDDHQAAIAVISKTPVQLLELKLLLVNLPWWIRSLLKSFDSMVEIEYIRGIPIPKKSFSRALSKGIGSWRIGGGEEIEFRYKE
jgi:hypothetical protein